ncbi:MAG TPA: copper amine oxidase N-terminal domain-containing protein, partial [Caldisericia bacterium]|nr:copper amine oxidase N-terminal domain-containing protein [Caldisericia bacterium]
VIFLWVGRDYAISGGTMVQLDAPPIIQGGRTYIPVRFVSEQLGAQVTWDGKNRIVTVKLKMD